MSKIDDLIKELCPNGVEWKMLGEVCTIQRGVRVVKSQLKTNGKYPVFQNSLAPMGYFDDYNRSACTTYLISAGTAGEVGFCDTNYWSADDCLCFLDCCGVKDKFLYYILKSKQTILYSNVRKASIPRLSKDIVAKIIIPLPPLPIQEEIVRILDKFVEQQEQLEKLIELRKKQYEYYREELLTPKEGEEWKVIPIRELGSITRGRRFVRDDVRESGMPCIHYGDMYTYYGITAKTTKTFLDRNFPKKMQFAKNGDVVVVGAGENDLDIGVGTVWEGDEPAAVHDACYILEHMQNPKYIAYFLRTNNYHRQIRKFVSEGKICSISGTGLGSCLIPLPSLAKQHEIAGILDKFENNISDMKIALKDSRKRYEHYRNELLRF